MPRVNDNYLKLKAGYLFPEIGRRVREFVKANPDAPIIRLGIGDVTEPLPPACIEAMTKAVADMGRRESFRGGVEGELRNRTSRHPAVRTPTLTMESRGGSGRG